MKPDKKVCTDINTPQKAPQNSTLATARTTGHHRVTVWKGDSLAQVSDTAHMALPKGHGEGEGQGGLQCSPCPMQCSLWCMSILFAIYTVSLIGIQLVSDVKPQTMHPDTKDFSSDLFRRDNVRPSRG